MKTIIFLSLSILLIITSSNDQLSTNIPQTFGFMTVTHTRGQDTSQIMSYLNRYAKMKCQLLTQINIVWNNELTPEQMGININSKDWIRPVNFYITPNNSMNWRYKIPKQSQAKVYFSIDDDITVECQELARGFKIWQKHAIIDLAPIVSYGPRYFQFTAKTGFNYGQIKQRDIFSIGLVGLAFVSRHLMELYYCNLWQAEEMRKVVILKNNCDDIGLNWITQYIYPQLQTIVIQGRILNISPRIAQATSPTHYKYRNQCIGKFTQIFGVNPLRYAPIKDRYQKMAGRSTPLKDFIIQAKRTYVQKYYLNNSEQTSSNLAQKRAQLIQLKSQTIINADQQNSTHQKITDQDISKKYIIKQNLERTISKQQLLKQTHSNIMQQWGQYQQILAQINNTNGHMDDPINSDAILRQIIILQDSVSIKYMTELLLGAVIIALLWHLCRTNKLQSKIGSKKMTSTVGKIQIQTSKMSDEEIEK